MSTKELLLQKDSLHHAYFIEGEKEAVLFDIENFLLKAFQIVREGNPDVHYAFHESFGIDDSKALQDMQSMKPIVGDKKIFIIALESITSEAQNSLLKVFEEPTLGTHFFIISSSQKILLPTLRSRMVIISHDSTKNQKNNTDIKEFISMSLRDRLAFISNMIETKDKTATENFLQALTAELHKTKNMKVIKEILSLTKYLKDRAPSIKLILERVALLDL